MQTKIIPSATRKVIDGNAHYYVGKGVLTLNDGKEIIFAIKTRQKSTALAEFQFHNGTAWQATDRIPKSLGMKFERFLQLVAPCFGNKLERNQLFLTDRLLHDATPANERPKYTAIMTKFTCLIGGEFIHVRKQFVGVGASRKVIETYHRMPLDMSKGWELFTPTDEFAMKNRIATACSYYRDKITSYNRYAYHKDQTRMGARM